MLCSAEGTMVHIFCQYDAAIQRTFRVLGNKYLEARNLTLSNLFEKTDFTVIAINLQHMEVYTIFQSEKVLSEIRTR